MKCVKFIKTINSKHYKESRDRVVRMPDSTAEMFVKYNEAVYTTKKEWKDTGRNYFKA